MIRIPDVPSIAEDMGQCLDHGLRVHYGEVHEDLAHEFDIAVTQRRDIQAISDISV